MPYKRGLLDSTSLGIPAFNYFPAEGGWLTAASVYYDPSGKNNAGPDYGQIFISFGQSSEFSKGIILAQGPITWTNGLFWTGKQLIEDEMYLGFMIRSFGGNIFHYGYFVEKPCPITSAPGEPVTYKC